ncbi:MAG TPA: hypothetical protein VIM77_08065 [Mucilaginibacter sp.]
MKKLLPLVLLCFFGVNIYAQQVNSDSVAYQLQRKKINNMLAARKSKFGQYEQSLSKHTGIFGLQTKKDIRRSSDILMDIARTDDAIFKELKILFEYSAFQQRQIQSHSHEAETINQNYLAAINKLKKRNIQLKAALIKAQEAQKAQSKNTTIYISVIGLMLASILYLLYKKNKPKP